MTSRAREPQGVTNATVIESNKYRRGPSMVLNRKSPKCIGYTMIFDPSEICKKKKYAIFTRPRIDASKIIENIVTAKPSLRFRIL